MSGFFHVEGRVERLQKLWDEGYSQTEIAVLMRTSRGTIAGQVSRMNLAKLKPTGERKKNRRLEPVDIPAPVAEVRFDNYEPEERQQSGAPQAISSLTEHQCKFQIGDPRSPDFHFCVGVKRPDSSYCEHHHKVTREYRNEKLTFQKVGDVAGRIMQGFGYR